MTMRGDSFAVGLGAVAGACVGRWTGQPRMPPRERLHEGLGGDWGIVSQAQEWMARGRLVFVFFFGGCSGVGGGFFHTLWRGCAGRGILPAVGAAGGEGAARGFGLWFWEWAEFQPAGAGDTGHFPSRLAL